MWPFGTSFWFLDCSLRTCLAWRITEGKRIPISDPELKWENGELINLSGFWLTENGMKLSCSTYNFASWSPLEFVFIGSKVFDQIGNSIDNLILKLNEAHLLKYSHGLAQSAQQLSPSLSLSSNHYLSILDIRLMAQSKYKHSHGWSKLMPQITKQHVDVMSFWMKIKQYSCEFSLVAISKISSNLS